MGKKGDLDRQSIHVSRCGVLKPVTYQEALSFLSKVLNPKSIESGNMTNMMLQRSEGLRMSALEPVNHKAAAERKCSFQY